MTDTAIQVSGLWKKFSKGESFDSLRDLVPSMARNVLRGRKRPELEAKEFWAVKDVSFEVPKGKALAIIGPNGSGKSTVLNS
jgi:lipopolysaccharide transport system ATP-binding protein